MANTDVGKLASVSPAVLFLNVPCVLFSCGPCASSPQLLPFALRGAPACGLPHWPWSPFHNPVLRAFAAPPFLVPLLCACLPSCADLGGLASFSPPRNNCSEGENNVRWVLPPTHLALMQFSWMARQKWVVRWPFEAIFYQGSDTESRSYVNILINIVLAVFLFSSVSS